jgi:hypothetical protein
VIRELRVSANLNCSVCYLKLGDSTRGLNFAERVNHCASECCRSLVAVITVIGVDFGTRTSESHLSSWPSVVCLFFFAGRQQPAAAWPLSNQYVMWMDARHYRLAKGDLEFAERDLNASAGAFPTDRGVKDDLKKLAEKRKLTATKVSAILWLMRCLFCLIDWFACRSESITKVISSHIFCYSFNGIADIAGQCGRRVGLFERGRPPKKVATEIALGEVLPTGAVATPAVAVDVVVATAAEDGLGALPTASLIAAAPCGSI